MRRRAGQRRVELTLHDKKKILTSTKNGKEHLLFGTGEKGNRLEGSGNQSTFEGAVTEWTKTLKLPTTAAAGRHTKAPTGSYTITRAAVVVFLLDF